MKRAIAVLLAFAVIGAWFALATASANRPIVRTVHIRTTITHDGFKNLGGDTFRLSGRVHVHSKSLREVCRSSRPVAVRVHYPDGTTRLADLRRASDGGVWTAKVNLTGADRVKAKALRVDAQSAPPAPPPHHHHRRPHITNVICRPAVVIWGVA